MLQVLEHQLRSVALSHRPDSIFDLHAVIVHRLNLPMAGPWLNIFLWSPFEPHLHVGIWRVYQIWQPMRLAAR
jgi:hypothetical protein